MDDTLSRSLTLTRHIPAPVARVWAAWTDPARLPLWWGPRGFTCRTKEIDLREGGLWRFDMIGPDGTVFPNRHRYTRIAPMEAIDYLNDDDGKGEIGFAASVRFAAEGAGARISLTMDLADAATRAMVEGFGAVEHGYTTLDCLTEAALPEPAVSITRSLPAPRARVWAAWTDPAQLAGWFFPDDCTLADARFDIRPGGGFDCTLIETATGKPFPMSASVEEIEPHRRIAFRHRWGGGAESRITITVEDAGAGARLFFLQEGIGEAPSRDSQFEGWSQVVERLAATLDAG